MMAMFDVTHRAAKTVKVDCLSDYERRELDCWIAEHIEQHEVLHSIDGVQLGSMCRLSDIAYYNFMRECPNHIPRYKGPYPIPFYSANPVLALNVFQDTEYAEGWIFVRQNSEWSGSNDGLTVRHCKSFALCLMLALQHEYNYQNRRENTHVSE